ncbi:DNA cytosine methyltransferase, partial [Pseudomonas amygdali pv. sesami]
WENVPGVLSDKGNAFGCFLGALAGEDCELQPSGKRWQDAGCVYGPKRTIAWRILDAQYFGLAQRRRRVFLVASARADFDPSAVLFEREGVRRDTAPRRGEGQDVAATLDARTEGGGFPGTDGATGGHVVAPPRWPLAYGGGRTGGPIEVAACLVAKGQKCDFEVESFVVHGTQDPSVSEGLAFALGRNSGQENVLAFSCKDHGADAGYIAPTLRAMGHGTSHANAGGQVAVCVTGDVTHTLKVEGFDGSEDGTGRGQPIVTYAIQAGALRTNPCSGPDGVGVQADHAYTLEARAEVQAIQSESSVRRLTPR